MALPDPRRWTQTIRRNDVGSAQVRRSAAVVVGDAAEAEQSVDTSPVHAAETPMNRITKTTRFVGIMVSSRRMAPVWRSIGEARTTRIYHRAAARVDEYSRPR